MFYCKPKNDEMLYEEAYAQKYLQPHAGWEMSPQARFPVCIVIEIHDPSLTVTKPCQNPVSWLKKLWKSVEERDMFISGILGTEA